MRTWLGNANDSDILDEANLKTPWWQTIRDTARYIYIEIYIYQIDYMIFTSESSCVMFSCVDTYKSAQKSWRRLAIVSMLNIYIYSCHRHAKAYLKIMFMKYHSEKQIEWRDTGPCHACDLDGPSLKVSASMKERSHRTPMPWLEIHALVSWTTARYKEVHIGGATWFRVHHRMEFRVEFEDKAIFPVNTGVTRGCQMVGITTLNII